MSTNPSSPLHPSFSNNIPMHRMSTSSVDLLRRTTAAAQESQRNTQPSLERTPTTPNIGSFSATPFSPARRQTPADPNAASSSALEEVLFEGPPTVRASPSQRIAAARAFAGRSFDGSSAAAARSTPLELDEGMHLSPIVPPIPRWESFFGTRPSPNPRGTLTPLMARNQQLELCEEKDRDFYMLLKEESREISKIRDAFYAIINVDSLRRFDAKYRPIEQQKDFLQEEELSRITILDEEAERFEADFYPKKALLKEEKRDRKAISNERTNELRTMYVDFQNSTLENFSQGEP